MRACIVLLVLAWQISSTNTPEDFFSNAWGAPLSRMREKYDLREISADAVRITYASSIRRLGNAELAECNLEFVRDRFAGVIVLTRGWSNSEQLLQFLKGRFGEGKVVDRTAINWIAGNIHVSYDIDGSGDAYVYWYSLPHQ